MTEWRNRVPIRLGVFLLGLLVVFAAAYGVGAVTGGADEPVPPVERESDHPVDHASDSIGEAR